MTAKDVYESVNALVAPLVSAGMPEDYTLQMPPDLALEICAIETPLGVPQFPNMTPRGGLLLGFKVIVTPLCKPGHIQLVRNFA